MADRIKDYICRLKGGDSSRKVVKDSANQKKIFNIFGSKGEPIVKIEIDLQVGLPCHMYFLFFFSNLSVQT
jgi:hypothetical protein